MGCGFKSCLLTLCVSNILSAQAYYGGSKYVWDFRAQSTKQDRITGEAPGGMFGSSVSTVDLVSAVGSPGYVRDAGATGAVFMYHRKTKTDHEWSEEEFVVADDGEDGDMFGCAVAVSGGVLMVGAMHHSAVASQSGAAYVYKRAVTLYNDGTWILNWDQVGKLAPDELLAQDYFGSSVAIHKNTTVIGAHGRDDGGTFSGAVYVYRVLFDEDGEAAFEYDQKIVAEEPTRYDMFGISVGIHGNFIIIGAPGVDYNGNTRSGAAYIFENLYSKNEEDSYLWTEVDMLVVADGAAEDSFGNAVAISGTTAVVGAEGSSHGSHVESGAAFVFTYFHDEWRYSHTLMTPSSEFDEYTGFGHALSIYKDTIVVASHSDSGPGAVFGYNLIQPQKGNYLWQHSFSRVSSSDDYGQEFGKTVSIFDGALVVGVPNSKYGSMISFVSNSTVDAYSFIPVEEEYFLESFSLPDAAVALIAISGTVLVVFVFVKYGSAIKKFVSQDDSSPFGGDRGSLVAGYDDVDLDSEHSTGSIGLTAVEQHTFSSRNPLNNRF